jgi:hypothetical protein
LDEERRLRKKFVATTMVNVNVRIDHMRDLFRSHPETRQLADDIIADLGTNGKARRPPFP